MQTGARLVALALAAVCTAAAGRVAVRQDGAPDGSDVPRLSLEAFKPLHADGRVLVIDVRSGASYRDGHIPGAMNVPVEEIDRRAGEIREAAKDRAIVTYCSCLNEHTSAAAARTLMARGLTRVAALVGGYPAWVAAGGAIARLGG